MERTPKQAKLYGKPAPLTPKTSGVLAFLNLTLANFGLISAGYTGAIMRYRNAKVLGYCAYNDTKLISLAHWYAEYGSAEAVADTILHEVAHALCEHRQLKRGHSKDWRRICLEVGANPQRLANLNKGKISREAALEAFPYVVGCANESCDMYEPFEIRTKRFRKLQQLSTVGLVRCQRCKLPATVLKGR